MVRVGTTLQAYPRYGGTHPETAALANVLAAQGVVAPHTGQPYSEAFVLGAGGGLGGGYWVFEFGGIPPVVVLGARNEWQSAPGLFAAKTAPRLGATASVHETSGSKAAAAQLTAALDEGTPAIVAVDMASVPHMLMSPEQVKYYYHLLVVVGQADEPDLLVVDDRAGVPLTIDRATLETARGAIPGMKRRLVTVTAATPPLDLEAVVRAAIAECADGLLDPPIRNFGLPAWQKWAELIAHAKDRKGWPAVFPPGPRLYGALCSAVSYIDAAGNGPGLLRPLYADFLDEAATVTGSGSCHELAERYRSIGAQWSALASRLLPDDVPTLAETRRLLLQRDHAFRVRGAEAFGEMRAIDARLQELSASFEVGWPLSEADTSALLDDARAQLLALHAAEVAAAEELRAI